MSKTICELKIELKARGIKGISGLNKSGLEALLKSGKSAPKKEVPKPKPFTPAATKGESPKVAEKTINKKIEPPKMLMLTYKPEKEKPKKEEPKEEPKKEVKSKSKVKIYKSAEEVKEEFIKIFLEGDLEFINDALHNKLIDPKEDILISDDRMKRMKQLQVTYFRSRPLKEEFVNEYNRLDTCQELMCKYGINSKDEFKKWVLKNHPDKGGKISDAEFKQIVKCAKKNKFCK
jgi:hypothetical protein